MKIPLLYTIRNLRARRLTTLLTAAGIALVVFVFSAVLMLAYGLQKTLIATGSEENVIVLRRSADSEVQSLLNREQANIIRSQPEIALGAGGRSLASPETVVLINLPKRKSGKPSNVQIRGVGIESLALRPQVRRVAGRLWQSGSAEVIVGKALAERFQGAGLGERMRFGAQDWTVVGLFEAQGTGFESEIWVDVDQLMQVFRREVFSSLTLRLKNPEDFQTMKARLETDPRLTVDAQREKAFYAKQSEVMARFIRILGIVVTLSFSLGAMIGAMVTMYAAVANRTVEIGTLRALGFSRRSILTAFLIESLLLSLIGGLMGLICASFLQIFTVSTTNWGTFSELAFRFSLSPSIALQSLLFALVMGLMGGFLPAVRAARQNIVQSLRTP